MCGIAGVLHTDGELVFFMFRIDAPDLPDVHFGIASGHMAPSGYIRDGIANNDYMNEHGKPGMISRWELEPGDLEKLEAGAPIYLSILGQVHPVVVHFQKSDTNKNFTLVSELHGIAYQIKKNLTEAVAITNHLCRYFMVDLIDEVKTFLRGFRCKYIHDLLNALTQVERMVIQFKVPGFNF